jgi:hypothetical protein
MKTLALLALLGAMMATSCRAPFGPVVNHADEIGMNGTPARE